MSKQSTIVLGEVSLKTWYRVARNVNGSWRYDPTTGDKALAQRRAREYQNAHMDRRVRVLWLKSNTMPAALTVDECGGTVRF